MMSRTEHLRRETQCGDVMKTDFEEKLGPPAKEYESIVLMTGGI